MRNLPPGLVAVATCGEQCAVGCLGVACMGGHGEAHRFLIKGFCRSATSHPPRILQASVFCNGLFRPGRAVRE